MSRRLATPSQIGNQLGYRPPVSLPDSFAEGPFRFRGSFDYDNAAAALDFLASASQVDKQWTTRFKAKASPEVYMHLEGITVDWLDTLITEAVDLETVYEVFENTYLEIEDAGQLSRFELFDACRIIGKEVTAIDSDLATIRLGKQFMSTPGYYELPTPIVIDMANVTTFSIKWASGAISVLGADSDVVAWLHGYAYSHGMPGADEDMVRKDVCNVAGSPDKLQLIGAGRKVSRARKAVVGKR